MKYLAILTLALTMLCCSSPSQKLAERGSEGMLEPSATVLESGGSGSEESVARIPALFGDLWRDSVAGWAVVGRAFSRGLTRDTDRIESLFD